MDFSGKTVLVTGASVGIGRECALAFARRGANVGVNFVRARSDAEETVARVEQAGGKGLLCQGDVSLEDDAKRIVSACAERFGGLDVLVNNAATTEFIPFADLDAAGGDVWMRLYGTNVVGAFFCAREAARVMGEKPGVIVNVASIAGQRPAGSSIPYAVSKAALIHLTKCLAVTLGPNIRVASVSPGAIDDTRWQAGRRDIDLDRMYADTAATTPLRRNGHGHDIAGTVAFLASDAASFVTGVDVLVDGGRALTT